GRGNTLTRGVITVIALVIEGGCDALVVRRNNTRADQAQRAGAVIDFLYCVGLGQVLRRIVNVLDDAGVGLEQRLLSLVIGFELEAIGDCWTSGRHVIT